MMYIFALVAAYFALLIVLSLMARPSRLRLVQLAHELACEEQKPEHRQLIKAILDSSYSMRSAPAHLAAVIIALLTPSAKFDNAAREWAKDNREFIEDARWSELYDCHITSIIAVNPIFGLPLSLARTLFQLKALLFARRLLRAEKAPKVPAIPAKTYSLYSEIKAEMVGSLKPAMAE